MDERLLGALQGAFFALTGLWPIFHLRSFEQVTGPKTDHWLVQTVGMLLAISGFVFFLASASDRLTTEIRLLALFESLGLAAVDVIFVYRRVIRKIYLWDAGVELLFGISWIAALF